MTLLDLIEQLSPLSGEDWEALCGQFLQSHPTQGRLAAGLRKKFASLWKKNIKTGDPTCPSEVRRAKQLKRELYKAADLADLEETAAIGVDATLHEEENDCSIQHAHEDDSSSRGGQPASYQ